MNLELLEKRALDIRRKIIKTAYLGKAGHISSSMSIVEILTILYFGIMRYEPEEPAWAYRDRLILSKGHGCLALYAALNEARFFDKDFLYSFCKPNSLIGAHPKLHDIPGVEASTGALGHGLSFGIGISVAAAIDKNDFNIYVILGDGECQEGSIWEGFLTASHRKLSNLTIIIDYNKFQATDEISKILSLENIAERLKKFDFEIFEINGHDFSQLIDTLRHKSNLTKIIIAHTRKGKGISCMENKSGWHGRLPDTSQMESVLKDLSLTCEEMNSL